MSSAVNSVVCTDPVTVLKKEASSGSGTLDECFSGLTANVIERKDGFAFVETEYGYRGWVSSASIREVSSANPWTPDLQTTHGFSDILEGPKYQTRILETLPAASRLRATGKNDNGWTEIKTAAGKTGWVRTDFVSPIPARPGCGDEERTRSALVATAKAFLGTQYRWGGKTAAGIDCSGLCSLSYLLNGFVIFRDAVFKPETFREISRSALKPGDLVYFPGHVAMCIGNNRVIHSTSPLSGVVINSLDPADADYRAQLAETVEHCATIFW